MAFSDLALKVCIIPSAASVGYKWVIRLLVEEENDSMSW